MARTKKNVSTEIYNDVKEAKENKDIIKEKDISDSDEVVIVSLIPNVSYKDNKNGDYYKWDEIGHEELMQFSVVKDMYRNYRGYFENLWIRPKDENVVNKLNLNRLYKKYDYLIDIKNYTKDNIEFICSEIELMNSRNSNLKFALFSRIVDSVQKEEITDFSVIKMLSKKFNLDLLNN